MLRLTGPGDLNAGGMHHRSSFRREEAGTPLDEEHVDRPNDERAKHVSITSQADHRHHVDDHGKHADREVVHSWDNECEGNAQRDHENGDGDGRRITECQSDIHADAELAFAAVLVLSEVALHEGLRTFTDRRQALHHDRDHSG